MDRIDSGLEAGVPADLAPESGPLLGGCVGDVVALRVTAALERVVQPEPVARFVSGREAEVVRPIAGNRGPRHRAEGDDDAVDPGLVVVGRREVRPAEVGAAVDRVDVQRVRAALAKRPLRLELVRPARRHIEPADVRRSVDTGEAEAKTGAGAPVEPCVAQVQYVDLIADPGIWHVALRDPSARADDVDVDRNRGLEVRGALRLAGRNLFEHLVQVGLAAFAAGAAAASGERVEEARSYPARRRIRRPREDTRPARARGGRE